MIIVFPVLYFGYKYAKKTKLLAPVEVDLHRNLDEIAEYESTFVPTPPKLATPLSPIWPIPHLQVRKVRTNI